MSPEPGVDAQNASTADPAPKPRFDRASFIPTVAVLAVAIAALAAAFMGAMQRSDSSETQSIAAMPAQPKPVVRAPPMVVTAAPLKQVKPAPAGRAQGSDASGTASAMGGAPACEKCGVVESVLAAKPGDRFQMRIRMDDGTLRTVEQRGALAAGTRVVVEGRSVRLPG
jgi:hypothetical protein